MGFIAMRDVLAALSEQLEVPLVSIDAPPVVSPETEALSPRFLRQFRCLPLSREDHTITLAMADPLDVETIAAVRHCTGLKVSTRARARAGDSWMRSTNITANRPRAPKRISNSKPARCRKISSTCATWRARRRSSAW